MISIIIPTYNELENITELVVRIKACLSEDYELIIVDDGSPDGTGLRAVTLVADHPIKVIQRGKMLGLASAIIDGFKLSCGDLICVMDSDLSHAPEIIPMLLQNLKQNNSDIVIGSRFTKDGKIENWSRLRLLATRLATLSVWPLTHVKDPMSGYFLFKRVVIQNVELIPRGFKILLEILVKGRYKKVTEYPIVFKDRVYGDSKLNLKIYMEFLVQYFDLCCHKLGFKNKN